MAKEKTAMLLKELSSEYKSTLACLQRINEDHFEYKPHPTSMAMGYLAVLVAEIPMWIRHMVEEGEIDFVTFSHPQPKNNADLVEFFEKSMNEARRALENLDDDALQKTFSLKRDGEVLYTAPLSADLPVTLNHWVHHRGQLTVYMRLAGIPVPSIYGPSGDDRSFTPPK